MKNIRKKIRLPDKEKALMFFVLLSATFVFVVGVFVVLFFYDFGKNKNFFTGVDFSRHYAESLGLNPRSVLYDIFHDLKVDKVRLSAPWNQIEKVEGEYDFSELDWQIDFAKEFEVEVLLSVGRRTPRWPECHDPEWLVYLSDEKIVEKQLLFVQEVINRYKKEEIITMWQVENEPMLNYFGKCPPADFDLLRKEVALVKTLDDRPILLTDSGELGHWLPVARLGDFFGTTIYRVVQNRWLGYFYYHLPPIFYNFKARVVGLTPDKVIVSELQAEPWVPNGILESSLKEQRKSMDANRLERHWEFARKTGFAGAYLWGAEYWYYLKEVLGDDSLWLTAGSLWQK